MLITTTGLLVTFGDHDLST